jgi:hypothetical protein
MVKLKGGAIWRNFSGASFFLVPIRHLYALMYREGLLEVSGKRRKGSDGCKCDGCTCATR